MQDLNSKFETRWFLEHIDVLESVTLEERKELIEHGICRCFEQGYTIFSSGDKAKSVYLLQQGKVKIFGITRDGHEVVYWNIYAGDVFGLAEACGYGSRTCFAEATVTSTVVEIPKHMFENLLKSNREIAFQFIKVLGARLRRSTEQSKSIAGDRVEQRLATHLLNIGQISGVQRSNGEILIRDRHTQQEMADSVGSSRQTVSETLREFRSRNLIKVERGRIVLIGVTQLRNLAT